MGLNQINIPRYFRLVKGTPEAGRTLVELISKLKAGKPLFIMGNHSSQLLGRPILDHFGWELPRWDELIIDANNRAQVDLVRRRIREEGHDLVVGIGSGRVLDVAKYGAALEGVNFLSMPTLLSHDGICSPVAVIKDEEGRNRSLGARMPSGIIIDLETIKKAPLRTIRAGIGDLVSNLSAIADWELAAARVGEHIDDFAALTSKTATIALLESKLTDITNETFLSMLANGLILSGVAMEIAGNSRPSSGSEHKFSHALDELCSLTNLHGEQVAVGVILCTYLRGGDWQEIKDFFERLAIATTAKHLGIGAEELVQALIHAPATRAGRYTVLEDVKIDAKLAREAARATGVID
ncbi:MAG: iron-containing alcohol dehydrogenase family protein [Thermincolia bacterium]